VILFSRYEVAAMLGLEDPQQGIDRLIASGALEVSAYSSEDNAPLFTTDAILGAWPAILPEELREEFFSPLPEDEQESPR
jgi:hypothetical protein